MTKDELFALLQQAVDLHRAGRLDEAAPLYQQVVDALPRGAEPHNMFGVLRMQQGRREEGLGLITTAVRLNPRSAEIVGNYAKALVDIGRFDDALVATEHLLTLQPDFPGASDTRAQLQKQLAGRALATEDFETVYRRCVLDLNAGRHLEALMGTTKALALKADGAECWNIQGSALRSLKRTTEALASFDRALTIDPHHPATLCNRGSLLADDMGRFEDALAAYDRALDWPGNFAECWYNRGNVLRQLGRLEEALASQTKALEQRPDFPDATRARAQILLELNRTEEGLALYRIVSKDFVEKSDEEGLPYKALHDQEQIEWLAKNGTSNAGARLAGPAVKLGNPRWTEISDAWDDLKPQVAVIDDLLTDEAITSLRRFCMEQQIWLQAHHGGYLNTFPEHGFACPLIGQIADELRAALPVILKHHGLIYFWGVKYDSRLPGIDIHGDQAAVNVNFWITPDECNLDPEGGGLIVWDVAAPVEWNFNKFNNSKNVIRDYLKSQNAKSVRIPYRQNRAAIFDSDLFHETDALNFKPGYENRRLNVTMLFGRRPLPSDRAPK